MILELQTMCCGSCLTWSSGLAISSEKFLFSSLVSRATASSRFCTSIPLIYKEKGGGVDGSMIRLCKTILYCFKPVSVAQAQLKQRTSGRLKRRLVFTKKGLVQPGAHSCRRRQPPEEWFTRWAVWTGVTGTPKGSTEREVLWRGKTSKQFNETELNVLRQEYKWNILKHDYHYFWKRSNGLMGIW